jgi:hypothetical protein
MLVSSLLFLLFVALVFRQIKSLDEGHFVFALDDPYIHLALSEQIAHGHYGINPREPSSPSSSILWPLLLAPLARYGFQLYMPLVLNTLFGLAAVLMIAFAVGRWPPHSAHQGSFVWWMKLLTIVLLMFVANLVSLTFIGMEHVLQVLVSIACAVGLAFAWDERRIPRWCIAAAAIAPMVRYEDLSLTLAVSLVLAATKQMKKAAALLIAGALPLVLFGLFLRHLGLPMLPTSVLVKGSIGLENAGPLGKTYELLRANYHAALDESARWPVLALGVILGCFLIKERNPGRRAVLFAGVMVAALQMAIGRFGWFNRYEVYALIFLALLYFRCVSSPRITAISPSDGVPIPIQYGTVVLVLFYLATPYIAATTQTAMASREIYRQQFQMHRFINDYYGKDVAMNDIGMASYRRPAGIYILDLVGLASLEAETATDRSPAWLQVIVDRRHIALAILYPEWFRIPSAWTPLGRMCDVELNHKVTAERCVVFYSTSPGSATEIHADLARFVPNLPPGVTFEFDPPRRVAGIFIP